MNCRTSAGLAKGPAPKNRHSRACASKPWHETCYVDPASNAKREESKMLEPEVFVLLGLGAALPYIGDAVYCWARDRIRHN